MGSRRRTDSKNSDSQPNAFVTALWITISLHRELIKTFPGGFSRATLPLKPLYNCWAGKAAGDKTNKGCCSLIEPGRRKRTSSGKTGI